MRRAVLKAGYFAAVLLSVTAGCSSGNNPDVLDAVSDIAVDIVAQDATDSIQPVDVHDAVTDTAVDSLSRDTADASDEGAVDATDVAAPDVEPLDVADAVDITIPDAVTDAPDSGADTQDSTVYECLIDEDCAGKVTVTACQTPYCNEDNICEAVNLEDDSDCSDNSICTTKDHCVEGQCVGETVDCNDNVECTQDLCSEANYCFHRPYYGPCNDSNACTTDDSCATGSCIGTEIICNDNNSCTTDSCDIGSGCVTTKLSGIKCNDNNLCTKNDVCVSGQCVGTFDCDDNNPCTQDGCNELGCTHDPLNGDICSDGLLCTENDACLAGFCTGTPVVCNDQDPCTDDYCQEGTGCKTRFNTANCDDSNACTRNDRCQYGLCKGTSYSCPILTCMDDNLCDGNGGCLPDYSDYGTPCASDGRQCTDDICSSGACIHPNSEAGTDCNDGDLCTQTDECSNGVCVGRDPVTCPVVDACKDPGTCDPFSGTCTLGVLPEGSSCNDGDRCTKNDRCTSGACAGTAVVCVAVNDCHQIGVCNPDDGTCTEVLKDDGTPCNDKNPCTQTDTCLDGTCVGGNQLACTALDACHVPGTCNVATGACTNPVAPNNTECNDGVACTREDVCTNGTCFGQAYSCNDNLSCTTETCDGEGGCSYDVLDNWCRINNTCVMPMSVSPTNACMSCDPARDQENWTPLDGGPCNDGDSCSYDDLCAEGICGGTPYSCDDGKECTTDSCNGFGGCDYSITPGWCLIDDECYFNGDQEPEHPCMACNTGISQTGFTPRQEGEQCDDGFACTYSDECHSDVCAGVAYTCDDSIDCTTDSCRGDGTCLFMPVPGYCFIEGACVTAGTVQPGNPCAACLTNVSKQSWSAYHEGESCDDGSICTENDVCLSGECGGVPKCGDDIPCTYDDCDEDTGICTNPVFEDYCVIDNNCYFVDDRNGLNSCERCVPMENDHDWTEMTGYTCDDDNPCTDNDACDGAVCIGTQRTCDDGLECTNDFCLYGRCGNIPIDGWCAIGNQCVASGASPQDNPCLICDPSMNPYEWSNTYLAACDDLNSCTVDDRCMFGFCVGQAYDCSDGAFCTTDFCDGLGGCTYTVNAGTCLIDGGCYEADDINIANACEFCEPVTSRDSWTPNNGLQCNDFNECTMDDACTGRACIGTPYDCDDERVCTSDACNGDGTCNNELIAGWCMIDGVCHRDQTLEPGNVCSACLSAISNDSWSPNNGQPCDDGQMCTWIDTCQDSACVGISYVCDDGTTCTTDECDGEGGCLATLAAGNCLIDRRCYINNQFNPDNLCLKCSASVSTGQWSPADGFACEDFDNCTVNTICSNGVCGKGSTYSCDDGIECTVDSCNGSGGCNDHPLAPDACLIDEVCYKAGDHKPGNPCLACAPDDDPLTTDDQYVWTDLSVGSVEICNGADDGCDGTTDPEGSAGCINYYRDADLDRVGVTTDFKCLCRPDEVYRAKLGGDCDDNEPEVYAGRPEACDGLDNDCDGITDPENTFGCQLFFMDNDGDMWGLGSDSKCLCSPSDKYTSVGAGDCDDNNAAVNKAATEVCNGIDDNCDGRADPESSPGCTNYYLDTDKDTWGDATVIRCLCAPTPEFSITRADDCNDMNALINPGRTELCNSIDDDCSGVEDDAQIEILCPHDPDAFENGFVVCEGSCFTVCDPSNPDLGEPAWYNLDGDNGNGCECQGDQMELTGEGKPVEPFAFGLLDDSDTIFTAGGNLSSQNEEDWFRITAEDLDRLLEPDSCDDFNLTVQFKSNPNSEFEMNVYRIRGSFYELICENRTKWDFATNFDDGKRGECPCDDHRCVEWPEGSEDLLECQRVEGEDWVNRCNLCGEHDPSMNICSDNSQQLMVVVHRRADAPATCSHYQLEVSNGHYEFIIQE